MNRLSTSNENTRLIIPIILITTKKRLLREEQPGAKTIYNYGRGDRILSLHFHIAHSTGFMFDIAWVMILACLSFIYVLVVISFNLIG